MTKKNNPRQSHARKRDIRKLDGPIERFQCDATPMDVCLVDEMAVSSRLRTFRKPLKREAFEKLGRQIVDRYVDKKSMQARSESHPEND